MNPWPIIVVLRCRLSLLTSLCDIYIRERNFLGVLIHRINPKSIYSFLQPKNDRRIINGSSRIFILPTEIQHLRRINMQVILLSLIVPCPSWASEMTPPIIRRMASTIFVVFGRTPDIPISFRIGTRGARFLKPFVKIGRMVDDQIKYSLHSPCVSSFYQASTSSTVPYGS